MVNGRECVQLLCDWKHRDDEGMVSVGEIPTVRKLFPCNTVYVYFFKDSACSVWTALSPTGDDVVMLYSLMCML